MFTKLLILTGFKHFYVKNNIKLNPVVFEYTVVTAKLHRYTSLKIDAVWRRWCRLAKKRCSLSIVQKLRPIVSFIMLEVIINNSEKCQKAKKESKLMIAEKSWVEKIPAYSSYNVKNYKPFIKCIQFRMTSLISIFFVKVHFII